MRYFTNLAEQSFKTSPTGERLFFRSGPWSKPFIVPDEAIERRLLKKQIWLMRIMCAFLVLGQPIFFQFIPAITKESLAYITYLLFVMFMWCGVSYILFRPELLNLERAKSRTPIKVFLKDKAQKHSIRSLALGVLASILLLAGGIGLLNTEANTFIIILCIGSFGACCTAWGYMLCYKISTRKVVH